MAGAAHIKHPGDIVYEACAFAVGLQHVDGLLQLEQAGINQDRSGLAAFAENVDGRYRAPPKPPAQHGGPETLPAFFQVDAERGLRYCS